jgi:hypothetical protein
METDDVILALLVEQLESNTGFQEALSLQSQRLRSGKIRRGALVHPNQSAFQHLFNSGQDDALVTLCGLDYAAFQELHILFKPLYEKYSPYGSDGFIRRLKKRSRRPRLLTSQQCLALYLAWSRTTGSMKVLQLIFGLTASHLSTWLRFARRLVVKSLKDDPRSRVAMPTDDELQEFIAAIEAKYPSLKDCWGAMDGLKLRLQQAGDNRIQRIFYNSWTHDHYVTNLFLFSPDGKIRRCFINAPGCLHDSTMAQWSGIYQAIDDLHARTGAKVVVDSAFANQQRNSLYKSHQNNISSRTGNVRQNSTINRDATSVRQLSEWGMRGLQGSFPRLKDRFVYEETGERKLVIQSIVLLYNFRASTVGLNQIQSSFMPHLERSANDFILG